MQDFRLRFIVILLLASAGCFGRAFAQDSLPAPLGIDVASPDLALSPDDAEIAPLPQSEESEEPAPNATGLSAIFSDPEAKGLSRDLQAVVKADARVTYDDNIFINRRSRQSDLIFTLSPTIAAGIGDVRPEFRRLALSTFSPVVVDETYDPGSFFFLRYTPTVNVFLDHGEEDSLDHDAAVEAQWQRNYLTLGFRTRFQTLSDPDIDVGGRVERSIFSQDFTALYDYSDRTSFEFRLRGAVRHYPGQIDSQEVVMEDAVNYRVGARTVVGLGLTLGWLKVEDAGSQPYEQLLVRGRYHLTEKIDAYGNAGIEFRQLEHQEDRIEPVFQVGLTYRPWDQTLLALGVARQLESSAGTPGFDIIYTEVNLEARQRFAGRYYLGFLGSFQSAQYLSVKGDSGSRRDQILFLQPYLKMDLSRSAAVEVGYSFQHDDSNVEQFTFNRSRVFTQLNVLF